MGKWKASIEHLLSKQNESLSALREIAAKHEANLSEHMRRTAILERRVDSMWSRALVIVSLLSGLAALIERFIR